MIGPMLGGGDVNVNVVRMTIRASVFGGSARTVYQGHPLFPGNIPIPQADAMFKEKMAQAMNEAVTIVATVDRRVAGLAREINLVAVAPLPADLARKAHAITNLIYRGNPDELNLLMDELASEGSEVAWQALEVVQYTYRKQWRGSFVGGNEKVRNEAKQHMHRLMHVMLDRFDPDSDFGFKALPVLTSMSVSMLNHIEKLRLDSNLRRVAAGQDANHIKFGDYNFAKEGGYSETHMLLLNEHVYPYLKTKWEEMQPDLAGGSRTKSAGNPQKPSRFIYIAGSSEKGIEGWQAARPSTIRQTIYVSHGMSAALAENSLALAELLTEEVGAHMDMERPFTDLATEEEAGKSLRQRLLEEYGNLHPGGEQPLTLKDLIEEGEEWKQRSPCATIPDGVDSTVPGTLYAENLAREVWRPIALIAQANSVAQPSSASSSGLPATVLPVRSILETVFGKESLSAENRYAQYAQDAANQMKIDAVVEVITGVPVEVDHKHLKTFVVFAQDEIGRVNIYIHALTFKFHRERGHLAEFVVTTLAHGHLKANGWSHGQVEAAGFPAEQTGHTSAKALARRFRQVRAGGGLGGTKLR